MSHQLLFRYRFTLGFFVLGLVISGLTAFPLQWEVAVLHRLTGGAVPTDYRQLHDLPGWIGFVQSGIAETYSRFPFFGYATDWLGFGHLVIAMFFLLPFANPVKYQAILRVGLVACVGVIMVAFIGGAIRSIPLGWRLIDCSFGVIGALPLLYCLSLTKRLT